MKRNVCVRCNKQIKWTKLGMKRAVVVRRSRNVMDVACTVHCYVNYMKSGERPSKLKERYFKSNKRWEGSSLEEADANARISWKNSVDELPKDANHAATDLSLA